MKWILLPLVAIIAWAQPPAAVLDLFRTAVETLADRDVDAFMTHFDSAMPGYTNLREQVAALVATEGATSTIDIVDDAGDESKRRVRIDWLLRSGYARPKRAVVTVTVEKRGRGWKITNLEPRDFFTAPSQ
ncbi:MAG: hypothetical protein ABI811_05730 [Acidobacteriota bacterium]